MKKYLFFIILFINLSSLVLAVDSINVKEFTGEIKNYSDEMFPEFSDENWLSEVINRKYEFGQARHMEKNC